MAADGFSGDLYSDRPYYSGWDSSRGQTTSHGAYTFFPGGTQTLAYAGGSTQQQAERLLPSLNRIFPGVQQQWLGTSERAYWPSNPFILASYSTLGPGQWTSIRVPAGFRWETCTSPVNTRASRGKGS